MPSKLEKLIPEVNYIPEMVTIEEVEQLSPSERLFTLRRDNSKPLNHEPGQFVQVWVPGIGEAPISITSSPTQDKIFQLCVRNVGDVTAALHSFKKGDKVGIRGPYGRGFNLDTMKGSDVFFIAGGIGLAPLRGGIKYLLDNRPQFKNITLLYGAKTYEDRIFKDELSEWEKRGDFKTIYTVDKGDPSWKGRVGLITMFFNELNINSLNSFVVICGPPIMYKYVLLGLRRFRVEPTKVILSLERRMRCGLGKCGHCQINNKYVCKDGPNFTWDELRNLGEAIT